MRNYLKKIFKKELKKKKKGTWVSSRLVLIVHLQKWWRKICMLICVMMLLVPQIVKTIHIKRKPIIHVELHRKAGDN